MQNLNLVDGTNFQVYLVNKSKGIVSTASIYDIVNNIISRRLNHESIEEFIETHSVLRPQRVNIYGMTPDSLVAEHKGKFIRIFAKADKVEFGQIFSTTKNLAMEELKLNPVIYEFIELSDLGIVTEEQLSKLENFFNCNQALNQNIINKLVLVKDKKYSDYVVNMVDWATFYKFLINTSSYKSLNYCEAYFKKSFKESTLETAIKRVETLGSNTDTIISVFLGETINDYNLVDEEEIKYTSGKVNVCLKNLRVYSNETKGKIRTGENKKLKLYTGGIYTEPVTLTELITKKDYTMLREIQHEIDQKLHNFIVLELDTLLN